MPALAYLKHSPRPVSRMYVLRVCSEYLQLLFACIGQTIYLTIRTTSRQPVKQWIWRAVGSLNSPVNTDHLCQTKLFGIPKTGKNNSESEYRNIRNIGMLISVLVFRSERLEQGIHNLRVSKALAVPIFSRKQVKTVSSCDSYLVWPECGLVA